MLWWLAQNSVTAALLACVVAVLCRLGRFRPAVRHALWLVVLVKLLTPPVVVWPWALPNLLSAEQSLPLRSEFSIPAELNPTAAPAQTIVVHFDSPLPGPPAPSSAEPVSNVDLITARAEPSGLWQVGWLTPAILYLWLAGTAGMAAVQVLRILRFRRLLTRGKRAPRCLLKQVDELAGKLKVRSPVTRLVARIGSPFVWGLGRAKLLWPALLMEALPSQCRRSVIAHELAHLRRRDHWVSWLQILAECVWWWNPLYWLVRRQLRLNAELACDAWVIGTLPEDRRAYAEALIEVTQHVSQTAAPMPALGMNGSARQVFERRLTMIMRDRIPHRVPQAGLIAIGLLAILALPGWTQVEGQPKKAETAPKKEGKDWRLDRIYSVQDLALDEIAVVEGKSILVELDQAARDASGAAKTATDEKRLKALEDKIQALLKEVQDLRKAAAGPTAQDRLLRLAAPQATTQPQNRQPVRVHLDTVVVQPQQLRTWQSVPATTERLRLSWVEHKSDNVVNLVRSTYKLPQAKAEVLAAFLREHVKAKVIETKVEGNSLTITTTPETQKALDGLIGLILDRSTAAKDKTGATRETWVQPVLSEKLDADQLKRRTMREATFRLLLDQVEKEGKQKANDPKKP